MKDNKTNQDFYIIGGNDDQTIQFDGSTYVRPFFTGQSVGWVRNVFVDSVTGRVNIFLITPEDWHLWYEISMRQLRRFRVDVPEIGTPMYFLTYQKKRYKEGNLPYTIGECCYCFDYLKAYDPPDFTRKS